MTYRYEFEIFLDFGDVGSVKASVVGTVTTCRLFGFGPGYTEKDIEKVVAHLDDGDWDVTDRIRKTAEICICEDLQREYENEHRRGA